MELVGTFFERLSVISGNKCLGSERSVLKHEHHVLRFELSLGILAVTNNN